MSETEEIRLVQEVYDIDPDQLHILADDSEYWLSASNFWGEVCDKPYSNLTDKQKKWLLKIENGLNRDNCR